MTEATSGRAHSTNAPGQGQAALLAVVEVAVAPLGQGEHRVADDAGDVRTPDSSGQSNTNIARSTPIWQAARPTPSAAYIVATMSAASRRRSSSYAVTGCWGRCMTGSPQRVIGRTTPPGGSGRGRGGVRHGADPSADRPGPTHARPTELATPSYTAVVPFDLTPTEDEQLLVDVARPTSPPRRCVRPLPRRTRPRVRRPDLLAAGRRDRARHPRRARGARGPGDRLHGDGTAPWSPRRSPTATWASRSPRSRPARWPPRWPGGAPPEQRDRPPGARGRRRTPRRHSRSDRAARCCSTRCAPATTATRGRRRLRAQRREVAGARAARTPSCSSSARCSTGARHCSSWSDPRAA